MLAKSLARTLGVTVRRMQFTPDLLPSDVTGVSVFNQESREFEFRPGAIFANVVLADEINRASPKTQSALLEAMEEHQVTVDGTSHPLASPFLVIATQNPIDMEGTYALPEAQRDRFMARISIGYPSPADELRMLTDHAGADPLATLAPAATHDELAALMAAVGEVHVSDAVRRLAVAPDDRHPHERRAAAGGITSRHTAPGPGLACVGCARRSHIRAARRHPDAGPDGPRPSGAAVGSDRRRWADRCRRDPGDRDTNPAIVVELMCHRDRSPRDRSAAGSV